MSSKKGLIVNILSFVTYTVSVATTQICHCSTKAVKDNIFKSGCRTSEKLGLYLIIIISPTSNSVFNKTH